jgi:hypothetical protein
LRGSASDQEPHGRYRRKPPATTGGQSVAGLFVPEYGFGVSDAKLGLIRQLAPDVFAGVGPKGTPAMPTPQAAVEPIALDGDVLTVLAHPPGTADKIAQAEGQIIAALAQRGTPVAAIEALEATRVEILLAHAVGELAGRVTELEGP